MPWPNLPTKKEPGWFRTRDLFGCRAYPFVTFSRPMPETEAGFPRRGTPFTRALAHRLLALGGWRVEGALPHEPRFVIIVAPHTSNWDFLIGVLAMFGVGVRLNWLGKHTLFRPPFGWIMRRWGGIPVDRSASHDVVPQIIASFSSRPRVFLVITPEGTRKQVSRWKTGFWHIAKGAGVPIVPIAFDWGSRVIHILPAFTPRETVDQDVAELQSRYAGIRGRTR